MGKYLGRAYCPECQEEVDVELIDNGIGAYEYWGFRGIDTRKEPCCSQCGDYLEDFQEEDAEADYWDREYDRRMGK